MTPLLNLIVTSFAQFFVHYLLRKNVDKMIKNVATSAAAERL